MTPIAGLAVLIDKKIHPKIKDRFEITESCLIGMVCSDLILVISTLTLGILGICSTISGMSETVSYALLGTGSFVVVAWTTFIILSLVRESSKDNRKKIQNNQ